MLRPPDVARKRARRQGVSPSVYAGRNSCMAFLLPVICFIHAASSVSSYYVGHKTRLTHHQRQPHWFRLYFLPNSLVRPTFDAKIDLYSTTINSLQQTPTINLAKKVNRFSSTNVDSLLSNNRTIAETTWQLLNHTEIGSWDRTDFEMMECIVESMCYSPSSPASYPQELRRGKQQSRHLKRAAFIIERFLHRIVQEQRMENPFADCVDMTALYTNLIHAWSKSYEIGSPERAEEILDYFQAIYEEGDSYDPLLCGPTIESFNAVIGAYAQSGRTDAPQQSIRVLTKLYELNKAGRTTASPNHESFAHVLRAWAKMATAESPEMVRRTLAHMDALASSYPTVKPDYRCHNEYFYALTESVNYRKIAAIDAAKLAERYLYKQLESNDETVLPDKWSFAMVLSLISRSNAPDLIHRAETVMARLEQYHEKSGRSEKTQPNANTYNSLMSCYTRHGNSEKAQKALKLLYKMKKISIKYNPSAAPSTVTYNTVMNAFAKSRRKDAPLKAEALLNEMYELYNATGDIRVRPNLGSLNTCLDAWAKSSIDGADERILGWIYKARNDTKQNTIKIMPDTWSYTHYLQALSRSGRAQMGDEAERVLNEVEELYQSGYQGLKPNGFTFTNAIHCIALSGQDDSVERALAILDRMEDLHAEGFGDVRPDLITYNCVINTVAKSKRRNKAAVAMQILRRMQSVAVQPSCVSFNNVINACAFSNHPDDDPESVLHIALDVLKEVQDGPGANWITYQSTIRVICSFVSDPDKRWQLAREIFRQCCDDGQLTRTVMTQVRFAVTEAQYSVLEDQVMTPGRNPSSSSSSTLNDQVNSTTRQLLDRYTVNARRSFLEGTTTVFRV